MYKRDVEAPPRLAREGWVPAGPEKRVNYAGPPEPGRAPWTAPVRAVAGIHNLLTDIGQRMSAPGG